MDFRTILKEKPHNQRHLNRYIKYIEKILELDLRTYDVLHHICPRGKYAWPEHINFNKNPWNKVKMTSKQHFIAHLLLWKTFPKNKTIIYGIYMMRNFQGRKITSRLYEELRKDVSQVISNTNKGRKHTAAQKEASSKRNMNLVTVYHIDNPNIYFKISKLDPIYDSTIHISYRIGYKHTEEVKNKIGRPGKVWATNGITNTMVYPTDIPEGFRLGNMLTSQYTDKSYLKNLIWCYNKITFENKRLYKNQITDEWEEGRWMPINLGFDKCNSMFNIVDFEMRKSCKTENINRVKHGPQSGTSTENTVIYTYDNKIFTNMKTVSNYCKQNEIEYGYKNCHSIIPIPHHNNTSDVKKFREKYAGLTYSELGIELYHLKDFDINEHKEKEIYW